MKAYLVLLGLFLCLGLACGEEYVLVNSAEGIDIISAVSYANVKGLDFNFLTSQQGATEAAFKAGTNRSILLVQSNNNPYSATLINDLRSNNNEVETLKSVDSLDTNLLLAERSGARRFIVVDTAYGYNPVSVIPYAAITGAYVIMADESVAQDLKLFFAGENPNWVMQYGYLDDAVKDVIAGVLTDTIDNGDKYLDNIEIVKKYLKETGAKQASAADGSFLEVGMAKGGEPVLLIAQIIPDSVYNYVKSSDINTLVLIGGDLAGAVDNMRERLRNEGKDLSLFIKFGQATPGVTGGVRKLDVFWLPAYPLELEVKSVAYNDATSALEVTYKNKVDAVAYVIADIRIIVDNQTVRTLGDTEPLFVARKAEKGVQYPLDLEGLEGDIYVEVKARYGSTATFFEKVLGARYLLTKISVVDESSLDATRLHYDKQAKQLSLTIKNTGEVDVFYTPTFDLQTDDGLKEFSPDTVGSLGAGKSKDVVFPGVDLSDEEIEANSQVPVHIDYGAREGFLTKTLDKTLELEVAKPAPPMDYTFVLIILACGVVLIVLWKTVPKLYVALAAALAKWKKRSMGLEVVSVNYNKAAKALEVAYRNYKGMTYLTTEIFLLVRNKAAGAVGDPKPFMLDKKAEVGRQYPIDLSKIEGEIFADVRIKFGPMEGAPEKLLTERRPVPLISFVDESKLDATKLHYDRKSKELLLTLKNPGAAIAFCLPEVKLHGKEALIGELGSLEPGKSKEAVFPDVELSKEDLERDKAVRVRVKYGARKEFLTKSAAGEMKLDADGAKAR